MIFGIGVDIIEVSRIKNEVSSLNNKFIERIYTDNEKKYCDLQPSKAQNYAARFAAKEAMFKAMGSGWSGGFSWKEIEVAKYPEGKPYIITHGKVKSFIEHNKISSIHLSISHVKDNAMAMIVMETGAK